MVFAHLLFNCKAQPGPLSTWEKLEEKVEVWVTGVKEAVASLEFNSRFLGGIAAIIPFPVIAAVIVFCPCFQSHRAGPGMKQVTGEELQAHLKPTGSLRVCPCPHLVCKAAQREAQHHEPLKAQTMDSKMGTLTRVHHFDNHANFDRDPAKPNHEAPEPQTQP